MDSNLKKRLSFYADAETVEKAKKESYKQIIGIVVGIVLILITVCLNDLQYEQLFDDSKKDYYGVLKICTLGIGLLEVILSPILLLEVMRVQRNLVQTRVVLYEDRIKGIYFIDPSVDLSGHEFEVMYENIVAVNTLVPTGAKGNNLSIETNDKTYYCYAIEQNKTAANRINLKIAEAKEKCKGA